MKVVITGFEPFLHYTENSSWEVASQVASCGDVCGVDVVKEILPVSFMRVGAVLRSVVERHNPELIILLGQAAGIDYIKLERIAINMMDARGADNDGYAPDEQIIDSSAPTAYITPLKIKTLCQAIARRGIEAKVSNSAGLYVCNRAYFEALRLCNERGSTKAIFVHLPYYEGQHSVSADQPTMSLEKMKLAIQTIIEEINDKDRTI